MYVKELEKFLTMKVLDNTPSSDSESFAMKTDIPANGSMVKNHISLKTGFGRKDGSSTTFLLCQCLIRLMIDQGNLRKPRSNGETVRV